MSKGSKYTREEKLAAVRLITDGGRTAASVAHEYGIHENTLYKWKQCAQMDPEHAFTAAEGQMPIDEAERLKRRVRELENEVEFLKKVSAYFAKSPQ